MRAPQLWVRLLADHVAASTGDDLLVPDPWSLVVFPLAMWVAGFVAERAWAQLDDFEDEGDVIPAAMWFCPWRWAPWFRDVLRRL